MKQYAVINLYDGKIISDSFLGTHVYDSLKELNECGYLLKNSEDLKEESSNFDNVRVIELDIKNMFKIKSTGIVLEKVNKPKRNKNKDKKR